MGESKYYIQVREKRYKNASKTERVFLEPFYYKGLLINQYQFSESEQERLMYNNINSCADDYACLKRHLIDTHNYDTFEIEIKQA